MKPFAFFFHYNKPASLKAGKVQISLHCHGQCRLVDNVTCYVTTQGRIRNTSPKFVMAGQAMEVIFDHGQVIIQ